MRFIADLQLHSKYSRATSSRMVLEELNLSARKKGIRVLGTGDFTHPQWFLELERKLMPASEAGLFVLNSEEKNLKATRFMLTAEISSIYSKGGRVRKVHNLVFAPSFEVVRQINIQLGWIGNLKSDGRPILGLDSKELLKIVSTISEEAYVIPAHAWTPWFSVFGSQSGFDSLEECFEELTPKIFAIETGLSSDPGMNWRLSQLDKVALISNSDSHSLPKLGREANAFEGDELSYRAIFQAIKNASPKALSEKRDSGAKLKLAFTIEFFPEEGKYHYDGHRQHQVVYSPEETAAQKGICRSCGRPVTIGVMNRVASLADRGAGYKPPFYTPFKNLVPLEEIIAEARGQKVGTKAVLQSYEKFIQVFGSEFGVLLDARVEDLGALDDVVAEGIRRVRVGGIKIEPGYDGEYGKIKIFEDLPKQKTLF
ncbi:MAG: DNA helicase UvrD [Candidatus Liptonbacteria bacterium]|nr:DNA helicase UvrD [Candidatus Liptonbacteria bacterium]